MSHLPSPIKFREDINGLRAWAVLAVILFHFQVPFFDAGFIGVDVFFVISGYLMTAIIVKGLVNNNFSLKKFYMARARRIWPALMVLIVVLMMLGWFLLPTPYYKNLAEESVNALFFISNVLFSGQAGYFDSAAHQKWLLHTWSLAVEAQFYVLFPIFLWMLWRIRDSISVLLSGLTFVFLLSFSWAVYSVNNVPSEAFYLLPSRSWELAVGGLVFLASQRLTLSPSWQKVALGFGIFLWVIAMALIDDKTPWPAYWALLPVLGTSLLILASNTSFPLSVHPLLQWLGDRSYSLYLWHWPLVVALYFVGYGQDLLFIVIAIIVSVILADLSYRWVEVPTRSILSAGSQKKEFYLLLVSALIIGSVAAAAQNFTFNGRLPSQVEMAANEATNINPRREECHTPAKGDEGSPGCIFGDKDVGVILIGDSHAVSSVTPLQNVMVDNERGVKLWSFSACPTLLGVHSYFRKDLCKQSTQWILEQLDQTSSDISVVIINSSDYIMSNQKPKIFFKAEYNSTMDKGFVSEYLESYSKTMCTIASKRPVYVVRPYPWMQENVPYVLSKNILLGNAKDIKVSRQEYLNKNSLIYAAQDKVATQCGVKILDPTPYLCDENFCYGSRNGRPLYYDQHHLSEFGNQLLTTMFSQVK